MLKVKRNDKCPCGSGKKYKKCCLTDPVKEAEILRAASMAHTHEEIYQIITKPIDIYKLKVQLISIRLEEIETEVSRTILMEGNDTLYDFHLRIQRAFNWDNDHMFSFYLSNKLSDRASEYSANPIGEHLVSMYGKPAKSAYDGQLRDLGLSKGKKFLYLFDYRDELLHSVTVEEIREKKSDDKNLAKIINRIGDAPPQYDYYEDDETDYEYRLLHK